MAKSQDLQEKMGQCLLSTCKVTFFYFFAAFFFFKLSQLGTWLTYLDVMEFCNGYIRRDA